MPLVEVIMKVSKTRRNFVLAEQQSSLDHSEHRLVIRGNERADNDPGIVRGDVDGGIQVGRRRHESERIEDFLRELIDRIASDRRVISERERWKASVDSAPWFWLR